MSPSPVPAGTHRWVGVLLLALGVMGLSAAQFLATRPAAANPGGLWWIALGCLGVGAAALVLPWHRWPNEALLTVAVASLGLLVLVDRVSGLSSTASAAVTYPTFVLLLLAWVGGSQPRHTALAFSLCAGAVLIGVSQASGSQALPLLALLVVVPSGALLGEAASWLRSEAATARRREAEGARLLAALALTLEELPERASLADAADLVATMACRVFDADAAQALLVTRDGEQLARSAGDVTLLADFDGRDRLRRLAHSPSDRGAEPSRTAGAAGSGSHHPQEGAGSGDEVGGPVEEAGPIAMGYNNQGGRAVRLEIVLRGATRTVGTVAVARPAANPGGRVPGDRRAPAVSDSYLAQLARLFGSQVGNAVEQFETIRALDHAVYHDELTGTGNRRHASALLNRLRPGDGIVLVDVDHFKEVNDRNGHRAGDDLLQALGTYLSTYVRGSDDVARFGGDEFLVVIRGGAGEVHATAKRLLGGWQDLGAQATISLGAAVHRPGDTADATLERADAALYRAKWAGRDQLAIAPD